MATLRRLIEIGDATPGFLMPVFTPYRGANYEVIQEIDFNHTISDFENATLSDLRGHINLSEETAIEAEVGGPAIWAFRDDLCEIHVGTAQEIQKIGLEILQADRLSKFPMAGAELASFCNAETSYPKVMTRAFEAIQRLSANGAEVWRDTVFLLPKIKEDLAARLPPLADLKYQIQNIFAISHGRTTHVYGPPDIMRRINEVDLPRWRRLAAVFEIDSFAPHEFHVERKKPQPNSYIWVIIGLGGIANHAITNSWFGGEYRYFDGEGVIFAHSPKPTVVENDDHTRRLLLAVLPSDLRQARLVEQISRQVSEPGAIRHLINIRPIGFGTPRKNKPSPVEVRKAFGNFDFFWILANHRQRQGSSYKSAASLSASNVASRFVRATARSLTSCLEEPIGRQIFDLTKGAQAFGLVGASRYRSTVDQREIVRRVLYSMICEDAHLHSAKSILILWPHFSAPEEPFTTIRLGRHTYSVEIVQRTANAAGAQDVVGFAIDVQISNRTDGDFIDFCISLFAGYGWVPRHVEGQSILLENEGEVLRIWASQSLKQTQDLIKSPPEFGKQGDIIVVNHTLTKSFRRQISSSGWHVIHYGEIGYFMESSYDAKLFVDW